MRRKILVIYHKNCYDGFTAAWAAWKKFGNKAEYIGVDPGELPSAFPKKSEVFILDNGYPITILKKLRAANKKVVVIDHHISRKADTEAFPENVFNNDHSGAVLAWRYFHPRKKIPMLLRYVEESDLWRWRMPNTHEINAYIRLKEFDFKEWSKLAKEIENVVSRKRAVFLGKILLEFTDNVVEEIVKKATKVRFEGYCTFTANNLSKKFTSFIGSRLVEKKPPIALIWYEDEEGLHVSLRSNGKVDVSKLAGKYGGGGHRAASSFTLKNRKKPWKRLKK